jgi:hypothetical protein
LQTTLNFVPTFSLTNTHVASNKSLLQGEWGVGGSCGQVSKSLGNRDFSCDIVFLRARDTAIGCKQVNTLVVRVCVRLLVGVVAASGVGFWWRWGSCDRRIRGKRPDLRKSSGPWRNTIIRWICGGRSHWMLALWSRFHRTRR